MTASTVRTIAPSAADPAGGSSRPFTLVAPALGFASGAATAIGAAPREHWSAALLLYPLIGS